MAPTDQSAERGVERGEDVSVSTFEFNPSAPEFVPCAGLPWVEDLANEVLDDTLQGKARRSFVRRGTNAMEAPGQVSTLVVKNLTLDLDKASILRYLEDRGVCPMDVELHLDASGAFRGTAFVRYASPCQAKAALDRLGVSPELGGRKARVEIQKSKMLIGRRCLEAELPQADLFVVRDEIERFLRDDTTVEVGLSPDFSVHQRKYAHSLAERHSLMHVTRQNQNGMCI
mmetsp:Transcript_46778/g.130254  ORF Transcript_46778/g.130254 Transcript_46778/m.130254 type:complete len:229 (-) Transcript_46778:13-699(-)